MKKHGIDYVGKITENIEYGMSNAIEIILNIIVDDGV